MPGHARRVAGDRNALWCVCIIYLTQRLIVRLFRFFIIAVISTFLIGFQNFLFSSSAATLTKKLRSLSFRAILRQDSAFCPPLAVCGPSNNFLVEFFDRDENSAGGLTSTLSDNPQKVNGLAGVALGA
jgi:ATP-binding cassette subfamily B (MDR/TAP) protein 1